LDWMNVSRSALEVLKKYRYVVIVLMAGILLMLLPDGTTQPEPSGPAPAADPAPDLQSQLEELLSHMEGAGKVKVLLTESAGSCILYQTDENTDTTASSTSIRRETVIVSDTQRQESGLVRQTIPPVYLGAVVLCQGADSAAVRLAVTEAVSRATGLASHNISVLKMK